MRTMVAGICGIIIGWEACMGLVMFLLWVGVAPIEDVYHGGLVVERYLKSEISEQEFEKEIARTLPGGKMFTDTWRVMLPILLPISAIVVGVVVGVIATEYEVIVSGVAWAVVMSLAWSFHTPTEHLDFVRSLIGTVVGAVLAIGIPFANTRKQRVFHRRGL